MAIVTISKIQHRKGLYEQLPQLAAAELGWAMDRRKLFIGNGLLTDGAPEIGNTEVLTEYSDILALSKQYNYRNSESGYNPVTSANNSQYNSIAYNAGLWIAVGSNGSITSTTDGVVWSNIISGVPNNLLAVTYALGYWIVVGSNGCILVSTGGSAWQQVNVATFSTFTSLASFNSYIYATSADGSIWSTVDGLVWNQTNTGLTNRKLTGMTYGNGIYVAVGSAGTVLYSQNAVTWFTAPAISSTDLNSVDYANGYFVTTGGSGKTYYSTDGQKWYRSLVDTFVGAATDGAYAYFLTSWGDIYRGSNNNTSLQMYTSVGVVDVYNALAYGNAMLVAVSDTGAIYNSTDLLNFTQRNTGSQPLTSVVYDDVSGAPKFIAVGNLGNILTSTNGIVWNLQTAVTTNNLNGVAVFSNGNYIAVGEAGTILVSTNGGTTWTTRVSGTTKDFRSVAVKPTSLSTGIAVLAGAGGIILSTTDLNTFTTVADGSVTVNAVTVDLNDINNVFYSSTQLPNLANSKVFVFSADNGQIIISDDLASFKSIPAATTANFTCATVAVNRLVVVGDGGLTYSTSTDITNFQTQSAFFSNSSHIPDCFTITHKLTNFIMAGEFGIVYQSSDLKYFHTTVGLKLAIRGVSVAQSQYVAVGDGGFVGVGNDLINWNTQTLAYGKTLTTRSIQAKLDDFVSVRDFGARGDGVSDDTAAINLALGELYVRWDNPTAQKTLYFPAGHYIVTDSIRVPSNAYIRGEGRNSTIIEQTRPGYLVPNVEWLFYIADSLQQIESSLGLNGASLPQNIKITDLTLKSPSDALWIDKANLVYLENVRFQGNVTDISNNTHSDLGRASTAINLRGTNITPAADITVRNCHIEYFNTGITVGNQQHVLNASIQNTKFENLNTGMEINTVGGQSRQITISNCMFDLIYSSAIITDNTINLTSTFNYYREVGNNLMGSNSPQDLVINFMTNCNGCASIADDFNRTETQALLVPKISESVSTVEWDFARGIRLGSFQQLNGQSRAILNSTTAYLGIGIDEAYSVGIGLEMLYTIRRGTAVRKGLFRVCTNGAQWQTDDDTSDVGDVGVVLTFDGTDIKYTSTNTGTSGLINYAIRYMEML